MKAEAWDVAVIGAGPAGSTAAAHLAGHGHCVLLVDRERFPRDKVCGDGLIADAIGALRRLGLFERVASLGNRLSAATVYSPSRIHFDVPGEFVTLKRRLLDDLIVEEALRRGTVFRCGRVTRVETDAGTDVSLSLDAPDQPIRARFALIATGAGSDLPVQMGLAARRSPSAVAMRCYVKSPADTDRLLVSYDRSITPGYAWIFPLGRGEFNIGCGVFYRSAAGALPNLRTLFRRFLLEFPPAAQVMENAAGMTPLRGAPLRCGLADAVQPGRGRILLAGESLGTTFQFTGEGIGKAMESGEIAADLIHQALSAKGFDLVGGYRERLEREFRPKYLGYRVAEDWLSRPWLNDLVARRIVRSCFLQEAVAGILAETVDPRAVFSVRGMLRSLWH